MNKHFDLASLLTILVTFALFVAALFFSGFTHDLLLEAGIFLVSVKLIIMSYKQSVASEAHLRELRAIRSMLERRAADGKDGGLTPPD